MRITRVVTVVVQTVETIAVWRGPASSTFALRASVDKGGRVMTAEALKQFIASYTDDVWNRRSVNIDAIDRYYGPGYVHHDPSRPDVTNLAEYKAWARDLQTALSDLHVAADALIAEGAMAVKRWTVTGVHAAPLAGIPATNNRVKFSGVSIYRFDNGRIVESWYVYDLFGLLQQLGALPAPQEATA
jgi:steroid delta-isomerase-like uncharacterized protein